MIQYVLSGENIRTMANFATMATNDNNSLTININNESNKFIRINNITDQIYQALIGKDLENQTLIITNLNYGTMPTHIMQRLIGRIMVTVNTINEKASKQIINSIIWAGTRRTLVHLVNESLIYNLMDRTVPLNNFKITVSNTMNQHFKKQDDDFDIYEIMINEQP